MNKSLVFSALLASSAAAIAQAPSDTTKLGPMTDPSEVVCVREAVIGSRVATRRVCRTRAEWAEARRQVRENVERAQNQTQTSGQ